MDYRPRPAFQSYLTFTPALEQMNADFLAGPSAPDNVLFRAEADDRQYPSEPDALSWPQLLTRYEPVDANHRWLLLRKSQPAREFSLIPLGQSTAPLGNWVTVPDSEDPIWVRVSVHPSAIGKLIGGIYKLPTIILGVTNPTGHISRHTLMPDVAEAGFLLSPQVLGEMPFAMLYSPHWREYLQDSRAVRISVVGLDSNSMLGDKFEARFYRLQYPHLDVPAVPGIDAYMRLHDALQQSKIFRAASPPRLELDEDGRIILSTSTLTQLLIPVPSAAHVLHLSFEVPQTSFEGGSDIQGVEFLAAAFEQNAAKKTTVTPIWSSVIRPPTGEKGEVEQNADIPLPTPPPPFVLLQSSAFPTDRVVSAYWLDIDFR
jgi:hypothetical protein